jgi:Ser/Thr protein kinase RdoA (MazF antagonist)
MLEIESLIHKISGHLPTAKSISIACISTTNPVYLAFSGQSDTPCFVVRPANSKSSKVSHELSLRLHQVNKALVPETVGLYEHNGTVYSVQRGASGTPWFQLLRTVATPEQWTILRTRAIEALRQFHEGVASVPEWNPRIHLGDALRSAYQGFLETDNEPAYPLTTFADSMADELDRLGAWDGTFQHGDFSLNNLLFEENKISVIDLEDFGITAMPLYDEFTLALSLDTLAPDRVKSTVAIELAACTQPMKYRYSFNRKTIQALFLFHLLLRLGAWSSAEKRQPYRQKLLHLLEQYTNKPDAYIGS